MGLGVSGTTKPLNSINQMIAMETALQIVLPIGFIALSIYCISKHRFFKSSGISNRWIQLGFLIKLTAAIALWMIYSQHYTTRSEADTFRYFDDSKILFESIHDNPVDFLKMVSGIQSDEPQLKSYYDRMNYWYDTYSPVNDNRAIIRLQAVLRIFSMGSYHVHMVIVCFLSLIGAVAIARVFGAFHQGSAPTIFSLFFLIPSTCFWGSGLMKDSLAVFALGLAIYHLAHWDKNALQCWRKTAWLLAALFVLMVVRFQFFLLLSPFAIGWVIAVLTSKTRPLSYLVITLATGILIVTGWNLISDNTLQQSLQLKREAFINLAVDQGANSIFSQQPMEIGFPGILLEAITGFVFAITKPLQLDSELLIKMASIENLVLLAMIVWLLIRIVRVKERVTSNLSMLALLFSITYLMIAGMTTPVAGALVRYKSIVLPLLIGPLLIMSGLRLPVDGWKTLFHES